MDIPPLIPACGSIAWMVRYRCPDPSHAGEASPLKSNNDKVYECETSHRYFRREEAGRITLVDLLSGRAVDASAFQDEPVGEDPEGRPRLNFMVDIPRVTGILDFDKLSLTPGEWRVISKMDGRSNLEEVRLLSGLKAVEVESILYKLMDAGLVEIRRRGK